MGNAQWLLEVALLLLLALTLFHALRLERALGVLKRDRAVLEALVEGFNESTRQAETGIDRLRHAADGAGRQMARQTETAQRLRDDLAFLADRSDKLAERLESAVRSARMFGDTISFPTSLASIPSQAPAPMPAPVAAPPLPSLQSAPPMPEPVTRPVLPLPQADSGSMPVLRSQAERDLMRALRAGG